jgi:hypothetical protein
MPKYSFNFWEESKWSITFEADSLEHARQIMEFAEQEADVDLLPEVERFFKKGDETWDYETLAEVED